MNTDELETLLAVLDEWLSTERDNFIYSQVAQAHTHLSNIYHLQTGKVWGAEFGEPTEINHHNN